MICAELVKINSKPMELMSKLDLKASDYRFVGLYDEYQTLKADGEKYWYIIAFLAEKYGISESSVKRLVRKCSSVVLAHTCHISVGASVTNALAPITSIVPSACPARQLRLPL